MKRRFMLSALCAGATFLAGVAWFAALPAEWRGWNAGSTVEAATGRATQGALRVLAKDGRAVAECPLKHTDVNAEISGSLARVRVTQEFVNPLSEKVEAVYVFPLPQAAAVDEMTMLVGDREIQGRIKRREEARAIYDAARNRGHVAALLDQERPNIFTQSVANLAPGATVKVTISYVEQLKYEDGTYSFVFPMVVGPRYIPGAPTGTPRDAQGRGWAPDTSQVPDASRITPPMTSAGTRAGHDISLKVRLDAGVPIDSVACESHEASLTRLDAARAEIELRDLTTIPNKDFILKYDVAGKKISDGLLAHRGPQGGFFSMILQPPERVAPVEVAPKELVFVLDTSGSMDGFPIEKAKETMALALDGLYPNDTFNLITFAGDTHVLFPQPVPATRENLRRARAFLASREGGGGTEMMTAIRAALDPSDKQDHVRIVCFMTDGFVGNDLEIIGEVQKHPNARVFSFGIGSSVNRFLLDKMAEEGRGEVEYVGLQDDGSAAAKRFHERVRNPLLTDLQIDWNGLPVADVYPKRLPDLFSAKPVVLTGRYTEGAKGTIRLTGRLAGQPFTREVAVDLPAAEPAHDVLATLWARTRIDDLMRQDFQGLQGGTPKPEVRDAITQLGLEYRLMTQFTSFVAVEDAIVTTGGVPRRVEVPVEMPEGVRLDVRQREEKTAAFDFSPMPERSIGAIVGGAIGSVVNQAAPPKPVPAQAPEPASPRKKDGPLSGEADQKLSPALRQWLSQPRDSSPKLALRLRLADKSPATIAMLKRLGAEILRNPAGSDAIFIRVPIGRVRELADLPAVKEVDLK